MNRIIKSAGAALALTVCGIGGAASAQTVVYKPAPAASLPAPLPVITMIKPVSALPSLNIPLVSPDPELIKLLPDPMADAPPTVSQRFLSLFQNTRLPSLTEQKASFDRSMINLASVLTGHTPTATEVANISSATVALDLALDATDGTFTGTLDSFNDLSETKTEHFKHIMAGQLTVARLESSYRSDAVAPAVYFKNPQNRLNRPAGIYQFEAGLFGAMLAKTKDELTLPGNLKTAFKPVFSAIDRVAAAWGQQTGRNPEQILTTPGLFTQAFRHARFADQEIIRRARTDQTVLIDSKGGKTNVGTVLSTIAKLNNVDSGLKVPPGLLAKYGNRAAQIWSYTQHLLGVGGAKAVAGDPKAVRPGYLARALKANPIAKTPSGVLDAISRKFSLLDSVTNALKGGPRL